MSPTDLAAKPSAPGLDATVATAQADMERLIQLGGLQSDPLRHPIRALSVHLDALATLTRTIERIISEQKPPISVEDIKALNKAIAANSAQSVQAQTFVAIRSAVMLEHRKFWLWAAAAILVTWGVMFGAGAYWHANTQQPPIRDVTSCVPTPQPGGGTAFTCTFWAQRPGSH